MTYNFGDSFDPYATIADGGLGYWDTVPTAFVALVGGRFTGSRAIDFTGGPTGTFTKSSGQNDQVHHFVFSLLQTGALSGTNLGAYFEILDGVTAQCSVVCRSDGAILLTSGGPAGTVLDTWTGAFTTNNVWYAFEVEVVVSNTTGSWAIRRGGNNVNDHALGSLNTRPTSTNNYANKLIFSQQGGTSLHHYIDDLYWQSGSATGNWLGDLRCLVRMPASDQSVQFSRLSPYNLLIAATNGSSVVTLGRAYYPSFTPAVNGTIGSVNVPMILGYTGNLKCSIFADNAGAVGVTVGSPATILVNPATGNNTVTFPTPVPVVARTKYYIGVIPDVGSGTFQSDNVGNDSIFGATVSYAAFPVNNPTTSGVFNALSITINITPTDNYSEVAEVQQNAATTYVYDSTVGDADFYGIAVAPITPAAVIATTVRAFMQKSDTGSRTGAVQLKSGGSTVAGNTITLTNSGWQWSWRTDTVDPNTSTAWTPTGVNNAQIGPTVIA